MIHIVIGTKAQLIKMAPIMCCFNKMSIPYRYISTGQHKHTVQDILDNFGLRDADVTLYHGKDIVSVSKMISWFLKMFVLSVFKKRKIFGKDASRNDIVLVHGDTLSTLVGAIMGRVAGMRVGHVEAGLRSFNYFHPFPEELTRLATFRLANVFFCPDEKAVDNLKKIKGIKINTQGNTLYDSLIFSGLANKIPETTNGLFGVVSLHRYENLYKKEALERVVSLVELVAKRHRLVFVTHKPTTIALEKFGLHSRLSENVNIQLVPRLDYFGFIAMVSQAEFLISDGGSNQEECSYIGKPLLLLRCATERQEGLGENCLLSRYDASLVETFSLNYREFRRPPAVLSGSPSEQICRYCSRL